MLNLVLALIGAYAIICIGAWVLHRYFIYLPDKTRYAPKDVGLAGVKEILFKGRGGVTLIAWYLPARGRKPTLLYFTGNSGSTANRAAKIEGLGASGLCAVLLHYPPFRGSWG